MVNVKPRVLDLIQARIVSSRLPGKVLTHLNGELTFLRICWEIDKAVTVDEIIVATSLDESEAQLLELLHSKEVECFRRDLDDVLSWFIGVLTNSEAEVVIRVTANCPLVLLKLVNQVVRDILISGMDYLSNTIIPTFPDALDIVNFTKEALLRAQWLKSVISGAWVCDFVNMKPAKTIQFE